MAGYGLHELAQLAHQLKLSPPRQRLRQLAGAERLVDLIDPRRRYPYDFVCYHITGYRPRDPAKSKALPGDVLLADVVRLIDELSRSVPIPLKACDGQPTYTIEAAAKRFNVSTKTIGRWRRRGLVGWRVVFADGKVRLVFTERAIRRFVRRHTELVRRGSAFRQLDEAERAALIQRATELLARRRMKLHEVAQKLADETGRAVETIRYTLRRHDQEHPDSALFAASGHPVVHPDYREIYASYRAGVKVSELAERFGRTRSAIYRILTEMRARELLDRPIEYVYNPEFEAPDADERILNAPAPPAAAPSRRPKPSSLAELPAYLQELYGTPLLTREQERDLFRRYNYLKFKAARLRETIDPLRASARLMTKIERLLDQANAVKNRITQANLRLVVSIAKRHVGKSGNLFELISDGNISLMRAVEKFDYARGNKFSTYASWAIMKNYARSIPEQQYHAARFVTGNDELLQATADPVSTEQTYEARMQGARESLAAGLQVLSQRERSVVFHHYGLGPNGRPMTLEQIGKLFGVTKERIRQIEQRALQKLREALAPSVLETLTE